MTDLTTTYMGLTLKNPIVPSASPLAKRVDSIKQMEDAGAAAITMYSLFEEQIDLEALAQHNFIEQTTFMSAEATAYFPKAADYNRGPDGYLELIRQAKEAVDVPVIGSLNGVTPGGWTRYARLIQDAGADALELNVYMIPTRLDLTSDGVENTYLEILRDVKASVKIPVAMKLSPYFSSLPNMARRLDKAGANAARALQPLLPARLRPGRVGRDAPPRAQHAVGDAAAVALDRHPLRPRQGLDGAHDRRPHVR